MSGATNLTGLVYQQRYVTYRALAALGLRATGGDPAEPTLVEFSVEGRTSGSSPVWDVRLAFSDGSIDLHECKDTEITKEDRLTFYDRLRAEVASGTPAEKVRPVWVTDPGKQTPNALKYLGGIPAAVAALDLAALANTAPARMNSMADAVREAVYRLCHYTGAEDGRTGLPRACTFTEAKALLERLRIDRYRFAELDRGVKLLATGVFEKGTAAAVNTFVTGVLSEAVVVAGSARYTIDGFVAAVGTVAVGKEVEGRVRRILSFRAGSGFVPPVRLIRWAGLPAQPTTRWELAERLPGYTPGRSYLVVAGMGVGKTVASQLAFEEEVARSDPARVLRLEARELGREDLEAAMRAACLLAGVGPAWVALDGLDEAPQELRRDWGRGLGVLSSLPNLTLFVTVRREVNAADEWIGQSAAGLSPVELRPLESGQVAEAFVAAGLPAPSNARLVEVLRNPFLLSLYADVVTPGDMPLAESGEATAFLVVDAFWGRRVRAESVGLRAVGAGGRTREPKRKAASFLAERAAAGDLTVERGTADPEVGAGLDMLLREGVIREQGAGAVAWVHDWLREYAIVDRLLSRVAGEPSAVRLARQIVADCAADHAARAAAAGGMKWVFANPAAGTPGDFLAELWAQNRGLAREALAVLLEGSSAAASLADLPDDLLLEALTLAANLGTPQWGGQVAALPEGRFFGPLGAELRPVAVDYELRVAPGDEGPSVAAVLRLVGRDLRRLRENGGYTRASYRALLEAASSAGVSGEPAVREWLVATGEVNDPVVLDDLLNAVAGMATAGEAAAAHDVYRSAAGLTSRVRREAIAELLVRRRLVLARGLIDLPCTDGLISGHVSSWGVAAVDLVAALIEAKQRLDWPSTVRFLRALAEAAGTPFTEELSFAPNHDQDPRVTTLADDDEGPMVRVASALSAAFREIAARGEASGFRALADAALRGRFAALVSLALLALCDSARGVVPRVEWHPEEAARLLAQPAVAALESIGDVRRLLVRGFGGSWDGAARAAAATAIREAGLPEAARLRELVEFRAWGVLTGEEASAVEQAAGAGELEEPVDPREEPLFTSGRADPPARHAAGTGWPHPEDEELVRLLERGVTEPDAADAHEAESVERRLRALDVLLGRDAALSDAWLGRVLGWCHRAVERMRRLSEPATGGEASLRPEAWRELLDGRAPWWGRIAEAALVRLDGPAPEAHAARDLNDSRFSYFGGDPIVGALGLLDVLLDIDLAAPFDAHRDRLAGTVTARWESWNPYTRAAVLSSLGPGIWRRSPALRSVLASAVRTEPNAVVVRYATDLLVDIAYAAPTPELADLVRRASVGGYDESLENLSGLLGAAAVRANVAAASGRDRELDALRRDALTLDWADRGTLAGFLAGVYHGATGVLPVGGEWPEDLEAAWLAVVREVAARWPFAGAGSADGGRFPVDSMFSVIAGVESDEARIRLFLGLFPTLESVLKEGDLADFCAAHFGMKGLVAGGHLRTRKGRASRAGLPATEPVEDALVAVCRASAERVGRWKVEGKTTTDQGWQSGLDGRDTAELIRCCLAASRDRERVKRALAPLVDILAGAGARQVAAALLTHLRRS